MPDTDQKSPNKIRIILADDHPLIRQAARSWIEKNLDMEIVAEANSGRETVNLVTKLKPDIVILDISMPDLNGIEVTRKIRSMYPEIKILVLSVHTDDEHISSLIQAGVDGYLTKDIIGEEIVHAIRTILDGERPFPITSSINSNDPITSDNALLLLLKTNSLNNIEMQILKLVATGMGNKEIAFKLGLSLRAVKANLTNIFLKLGVSSRTGAVFVGVKSGVLNINDCKT